MSNSIKGPGAPPATNFDRISTKLDKAADELKNDAANLAKQAGSNVGQAGYDAKVVAGSVIGAGAEALFATGKVLEGTALLGEAALRTATAGGYATLGAAGWSTEQVRSGGRFAAENAARGLSGIANGITAIIGDGKQVTVQEMAGDPNAVRFSERMFGKAGKELQLSADAAALSWQSYVGAVAHSVNSAVDLAQAAGYSVAVAGNLAAAAVDLGAAGTVKLAQYGVELASVASQAVEQGLVGARELVILAAKAQAGTANLLANPDQGKVQVLVQDRQAQFRNELAALVKSNPALTPVTANLLKAA